MSNHKKFSKRFEHHPSWRDAYIILWQWELLSQENLEVLFRHAGLSPPADWERAMRHKRDCKALIQFLKGQLGDADDINPGGIPRTGSGPLQMH